LEAYELSPIAGAMQRRLRLAGMLIVLALLVEVISLFWTSPIAFLVFMFAGGLLLTIGILVYLYSLVSVTRMPVKK
jgi:predicted membrane channel-forming protein YqfA (hemolysin III family)